MSVKKRLTKLIENAPVWKNASFAEACAQVADHLIANGVTVREKAEWKWRQSKSNGNFWYMCSNCGFAPDEEHIVPTAVLI